MKTRYRPKPGALGGTVLFLVLAVSPVPAQDFTIDWFTVHGCGQSTGGIYAVTGTIGQQVGGTLAGGNFTLASGYWGVIAAVQTDGAPRLAVELTNQVMCVSWMASAGAWVLEETNWVSGLPGPWPQVAPPSYQTNGTQIYIAVPAPAGNRFFRLRKP